MLLFIAVGSSVVLIAILCVVLGSALGAAARYFVSSVIARRFGGSFPWGTLIVNVTGALAIGVVAALAGRSVASFASPEPWLFAVTGFLGCYTTVSSFSLQTLLLAHDGEATRAASNVVLSLLLCLGAVALGFAGADAIVR